MPHDPMSASEIALRIAVGVVLILTNAFFVVTEFALTRLRQLPEEEFRDHPGLRRAWQMTEKLEIYLTGCQVGISLSSILLGIVAEPAVTALFLPVFEALGLPERAVPATSVVIAIVILNLVHKVWGEQAPTYLGVEEPKRVARWTAVPHYWWCKATYPLILIGDGMAKWTLRLFGVEMRRSWTDEGGGDGDGDGDEPSKAQPTRADLRREMGAILSRGRVPTDRREEVIRALEIDEIPVRDIMVPRDRILAVSTGRTIEENLATMASDHLSRFPLVGDTLDDFRGILYLPEVFRAYDALRSGATTLEEIAVDPLVVPADLPVARLIDRFQHERQEIALVAEVEERARTNGGGGRIVGLVTITEAFEAISGDVEDPYD